MNIRNFLKRVGFMVTCACTGIFIGVAGAEYLMWMHDLIKPHGLGLIAEMLITFLPPIFVGSCLIAGIFSWRDRP